MNSNKNIIAQDIARETMHELHHFIKVGMSEKSIADKCKQLMEEKGSNGWWYHGVPAMVLLGERSILSLSGRQYQPLDDSCVSDTDVVTIDLAPTVDGYWGDYARTIFIEEGVVAGDDSPRLPAFQEGLAAEYYLHAKLIEMATPEMKYEDLYYALNREINALGFENLDFHGNLGHSVELIESDRVYIEKGVKATFAEVGRTFTLEPHIRVVGSRYGFKREDIYYFDESGRLQRL